MKNEKAMNGQEASAIFKNIVVEEDNEEKKEEQQQNNEDIELEIELA